jgi:hypothetical protein
MGLIVKEVEIAGDKGTKKVKALFDSGAFLSLARRSVVQNVATEVKMPRSVSFQLGDGEGRLTTERWVPLFITVKGVEISDNVVVVDKLAEELIIGAGTLQKWRIKLDLENDDVLIDPRVAELKLI